MRSRSRSLHKTHSKRKYRSHSRSKQRSRSRSRSRSRESSPRRGDGSHRSRWRGALPARDRRRSPESKSKELDKYRHERYENKEKKWEATKNDSEKWPNDLYNAENVSAKSSTMLMKPIKKSVEDQFMDSRRLQREIIGIEGVPFVWGKSPPRMEV